MGWGAGDGANSSSTEQASQRSATASTESSATSPSQIGQLTMIMVAAEPPSVRVIVARSSLSVVTALMSR